MRRHRRATQEVIRLACTPALTDRLQTAKSLAIAMEAILNQSEVLGIGKEGEQRRKLAVFTLVAFFSIGIGAANTHSAVPAVASQTNSSALVQPINSTNYWANRRPPASFHAGNYRHGSAQERAAAAFQDTINNRTNRFFVRSWNAPEFLPQKQFVFEQIRQTDPAVQATWLKLQNKVHGLLRANPSFNRDPKLLKDLHAVAASSFAPLQFTTRIFDHGITGHRVLYVVYWWEVTMREHVDCAPLLKEVFAKADATWKTWWAGAADYPLDTLREQPVTFGMFWSDVICSGLHTELSDEIGVTLEPDTPRSTFLTRANVSFKSRPRRLGLNKASAWELLDTMYLDPALSRHLGIVLTNRHLADLVKRQVKSAEENIMSPILSDTETASGVTARKAIAEAQRDHLIRIAPTLINRIDQFEARVRARLRGAAVLPQVEPVPSLR